jgi:hypothetical protein
MAEKHFAEKVRQCKVIAPQGKDHAALPGDYRFDS